MTRRGKWLFSLLAALVLGVSTAHAKIIAPSLPTAPAAAPAVTQTDRDDTQQDAAQSYPDLQPPPLVYVPESCVVAEYPPLPGDILLARDFLGRIWYMRVEGAEVHNGEFYYALSPLGLYGNPVSIGNGASVGPANPWDIGRPLHVSSPIPPMTPGEKFVAGVGIGAAGAIVVTLGAPVVYAGLVAVGVPTATASASVTLGLGATATIGGIFTAYDIGVNAQNRNWGNVAYDAGTLFGASAIGGLGGGRFIADNTSPSPSTVKPSWNPFTADSDYGFVRNPDLPWLQDRWNWLGTGPTPSSGGGAAALTSAGIGAFTQPATSGCSK